MTPWYLSSLLTQCGFTSVSSVSLRQSIAATTHGAIALAAALDTEDAEDRRLNEYVPF